MHVKRKNPLKIYYCNSRSFFPKIDKLKIIITRISPAIICVCETWLCESIPLSAVNIPGYNCYRKDNISDNPSGGLLIYVLESLNSSPIVSDDIQTCDGVEFLAITIQMNFNKKFIICLFYNHPPVNLAMFENNCSIIENLISKNKNLYICGDLNINMLRTKNNSISRKFSIFLKRFKLNQSVSFPTRICNNGANVVTESLIDLFITNANDSVDEITHNTFEQMADHRDLIITLSLHIKTPKKSFVYEIRDKSKYSKNAFCNSLVESGIVDSVRTDDVEYGVEIFTRCFNNVLDEMCPSKIIKCKYDFGVKSNEALDKAFKN